MPTPNDAPRYTLRDNERLHSQRDFRRVLDTGLKLTHPALFVFVHHNHDGSDIRRLGLVTGRKLGIAAARNRIKRRLREIFRLNKFSLPGGTDIVFIPRKNGMGLDYRQLESVVLALLAKAKK